MSEWKPAKLGDIADMCLGKMLDKEKNKGVLQPYLANLNVRWGGFELSNLSTMRFEESESERYGLRSGDLVICEGGEPGRCAIWRDEVPEMKIQKAIHRLRTNKNYSNEFVYYQFLLAGRNGELAKHFNGSTIKHLTGYSLKQVEFKFPSLAEQNRIAAVLSALDSKIALNHRINSELEGMAKLLYDYWFVQYDFPLSAAQAAALGKPRLAGKPYRSSGGPMVYHEHLKREIPKGWEVSTIGETFNTHLGGTPSRKEPSYWNPGEIAWLSSGEKEQLFVSAPDETISRKGLANSPATLLPAGTVILSIVRHIRASILAIEAATNQSVLGIRETAAIKHCFIYPFIMGEIPRYMILRTGAQQPHINKGTVDETPFVIPAAETLKAYTAIAAPIFEQIQNLQQQNQELTTLRDWLLPMLMNGQVRVTG